MAGRVLTGDWSVVKTFGIDACWENTFRPNWSFMRLFALSCRLEKTDTLPNLMEVYAPFSRGRVFSRLTATSQGVIERPFCRLSSQPVIFQLTLVTPFKKAHSFGAFCRVAPAREKNLSRDRIIKNVILFATLVVSWKGIPRISNRVWLRKSCLRQMKNTFIASYLLKCYITWLVGNGPKNELSNTRFYVCCSLFLLFSFVCLFDSGSFSEMNEFNYCLNNFLFASDRGPCGGEGIRKPLRHSSLHALTQPV